MDEVRSRIRSSIDLEEMGHQVGELMIPWSDNSVPIGYHPIPIINIKNNDPKAEGSLAERVPKLSQISFFGNE